MLSIERNWKCYIDRDTDVSFQQITEENEHYLQLSFYGDGDFESGGATLSVDQIKFMMRVFQEFLNRTPTPEQLASIRELAAPSLSYFQTYVGWEFEVYAYLQRFAKGQVWDILLIEEALTKLFNGINQKGQR